MSFETLSFFEIPVGFQEEVITKITNLIKKGESVQLVGAPGSGNSLIVKALTQSVKIQKKYFGKELNDHLFVRLDGTTLLERKPINLSRLFLSLFIIGEPIPSDEVVLQKMIEQTVSGICLKKKLILIIDHLEEIDSPEFKMFYTNLNQIFRRFEPKMSLIFVTSKELKTQGDLENFGSLGRVLVQNFVYTPPFDKNDAFWFIEERDNQVGIRLNGEQKNKIFQLSGGFPRTIKRLLEAVGKGMELSDLEKNPNIDLSLSMHLTELNNYKDLLPDISILERFLENSVSVNGMMERCEGIEIPIRLTRNENKLLKLFLGKKSKIVSREDGIEYLWGERSLNVSNHAYDQVILRIRKKLQNSTPKAKIETVRGRGHILKMASS